MLHPHDQNDGGATNKEGCSLGPLRHLRPLVYILNGPEAFQVIMPGVKNNFPITYFQTVILLAVRLPCVHYVIPLLGIEKLET